MMVEVTCDVGIATYLQYGVLVPVRTGTVLVFIPVPVLSVLVLQ